MADITMCVGTECPLRETCYRYTAKVNPYSQSFSDFTGKVTVLSIDDGYSTPTPYCPEYVPNTTM